MAAVSFVIAVAAAIGLLGAPLGNGGQITVGTIGSIFAAPITALVAAILYFQLAEREREAGAIAAEPEPAPAVWALRFPDR